MKIIFNFLFSIVFSSVVLFSQCPFDDCINDGTQANPYELWTKEHLIELGDSINNDYAYLGKIPWTKEKHFKLMQDINNVTQSIGLGYFRGYFNGNGKKITVAISYSMSTQNTVGALFSGIVSGATINNLTVDGYIIDGWAGIVGTVGGAWNNSYPASTVTNCTSNVTITSSDGAGGIVLLNRGIISNCVFNGSITGANRIGGIAGDNDLGGLIINCINNGRITATASGGNSIFSGVGGIVGCVPNDCTGISNNINNGIVEGQGFVGGIVGSVRAGMVQSPVHNNINYGFVKGTTAVGGVVGNIFSGGAGVNVFNNFNSGVVMGVSETGCIVGRNNGGTISNNHYDKQMCGE